MSVLKRTVRNVAPWILIASIVSFAMMARADVPTTGSWIVSRTSDEQVDLELSIRTSTSEWNDGNTQSFDEFHGLNGAQLDGGGATVHFTIVRDAGSLVCDGWVAHGGGGGAFAYAPSAAFARELAQRGMGSIGAMVQFRMTMADVSLAYIDELRGDGYRPSADDIITMMDHGVGERYVKALAAIGYHPKSVDDLIRMRDHGVSVDFVASMKQEGYRPSIVDLIRLRDHGISAAYVERLKNDGYHPSIDDLIRLHDNGI